MPLEGMLLESGPKLNVILRAGYNILSLPLASRISDALLSLRYSLITKKPSASFLPNIVVVVPVFNVEKYLALCLKSLIAQNYKNLRVILVDDGSTDNSLAIAKEFTKKLNLQIISQPNQGLGAARNAGVAGIGNSTCEYLMFLDSDDALAPNALHDLAVQAKLTNSDFVIGDTTRMKGLTRLKRRDTRAVFAKGTLNAITFAEHPAVIQDLTAWNRLFRFEFYQQQKLEFPTGVFFEDMTLMTRALIAAKTFDILAKPVIFWRVRTEGVRSITQQTGDSNKIADRIKSLHEQRDLIAKAIIEGKAKQENLMALYERVKNHDFKLYQKTASKVELDLFAEFLKPGI